MIDLHMHTTYSDGDDSLKNVLSNCENLGLEVISITDHNSCKGYYEIDSFNVKDYYSGKIIIGCEFTVSFDNRVIEALGYGFDKDKVEEYLNNYYTVDQLQKEATTLYYECINKIKELGLIYNLPVEENAIIYNTYFKTDIYEELAKYPENKDILGEDIFDSLNDFYRKGLTNKNSKMYIDFARFKPNIREIVDLIHDNGGIAFLAHPYQYDFDDIDYFLDKIYDELSLDGIECFYTTFSDEETNYLLSFAKKRNLLISGGSDYHGESRKENKLGVGKGNLNITKDIVLNWGIQYYK